MPRLPRGVPSARIPSYSQVSEADFLALLTYSFVFFEDEARTQRAPHQIYKEFNAVCRAYAHADPPPAGLRAEWELFKPLAFHLNAAIKALPCVSAVLFRGGGYAIDTAAYPVGHCGSWGGCISASADRHQVSLLLLPPPRPAAVAAAAAAHLRIVSETSTMLLCGNRQRDVTGHQS